MMLSKSLISKLLGSNENAKTKQKEAVARRCSVKRCSWKFRKIHMKTPAPAGTGFFPMNFPKNLFSYRIPPVAASLESLSRTL